MEPRPAQKGEGWGGTVKIVIHGVPREVFLLVISRVVGIEFSIRPNVSVYVCTWSSFQGGILLRFVVEASWQKERGWDERDKGVENGDLGFGMIPGGAGFVFIPFWTRGSQDVCAMAYHRGWRDVYL